MVPNKYTVDSLTGMDWNTLSLYTNVSRKFITIGHGKFVPLDEVTETKYGGSGQLEQQNTWSKTKGIDVTKIMDNLLYRNKHHYKGENNYLVCYKDRFNKNLLEVEMWRFKEEMDVPSHRVQMLKCNNKLVWDKNTKFSIL